MQIVSGILENSSVLVLRNLVYKMNNWKIWCTHNSHYAPTKLNELLEMKEKMEIYNLKFQIKAKI